MGDRTKDIVSFRVRPEVLARVQPVVQAQGMRTGKMSDKYTVKPTLSLFISDLLEAVADRRVVVLSQAAPHTPNDGAHPDWPVLTDRGNRNAA